MSRKDFLIEKLQLQSHPEGGFYRETYRSKGVVDFDGERSFSTCIYFMLTSDGFSAFHRIRQDEIWHFYEGSAVLIHMISPEGDYSSVRVGADLAKGEEFHFVVPAEYWFAITPKFDDPKQVSAWFCKDVSNDEPIEDQKDCLRWFTHIQSDGNRFKNTVK